MRFREFKDIKESKSSDSTRYNSEVGMLAAFCDADITNFDPKNPAASFPNPQLLEDSATTFRDIIKFLAPVYNVKVFTQFYGLGRTYKEKIVQELAALNEPAISAISWSGGSNINPDGAADIIFAGHPTVHGVSIKDKSGITLKNLTPKAVGLSTDDPLEDPDVFARYALDEWTALKSYAVEQVLTVAESQPGQPYFPIKPKYQIVYHSQPLAVAATPKKKVKPSPGVANKHATLAVSKQPMGQEPAEPLELDEPTDINPAPLKESATGYFEFSFGDPKTSKFTRDQITGAISKNATWQRVFGDFVQANWKTDANLRQLGDKLFSSISEIFVNRIRTSLETNTNLHKILAMGKLGYFYATPDALWYVPSTDTLDDLKLKDLIYGAPDGTAQKFIAKVGFEGGKQDAQILVYIRYANGMFDTNPTVRAQDLKNPDGLTWTKLI